MSVVVCYKAERDTLCFSLFAYSLPLSLFRNFRFGGGRDDAAWTWHGSSQHGTAAAATAAVPAAAAAAVRHDAAAGSGAAAHVGPFRPSSVAAHQRRRGPYPLDRRFAVLDGRELSLQLLRSHRRGITSLFLSSSFLLCIIRVFFSRVIILNCKFNLDRFNIGLCRSEGGFFIVVLVK